MRKHHLAVLPDRVRDAVGHLRTGGMGGVVGADGFGVGVGHHRELVAAGFGGEFLQRVDVVMRYADHGGAQLLELRRGLGKRMGL
ncbi:hypothetical protein SDC9_201485 [bioreactor metagenome]|uniref:Uncharacterized protein n=1 Tax=bioreactor metagenome TaxID=1076179 RepID=A0A645ITU4_9ZZZZ